MMMPEQVKEQDFQMMIHDLETLEPWELSSSDAFDCFQASPVFQNCQQKKKENFDSDKKGKTKLPLPFPSEILCRVARKQSEDTIESFDYYMHSKKMIEIEKEAESTSDRLLPRESTQVDGVDHHLAIITPEDLSDHWKQEKPAQMKKKSRACTPRVIGSPDNVDLVNDPIPIPFRPISRGSEPSMMKKSFHCFDLNMHSSIMTLDSNEVLMSPKELTSLYEWRKNKAIAAVSMKKLKSLFPLTIPKQDKRPLSSRSEFTRRIELESKSFVTCQKIFSLTKDESVLKTKESMNRIKFFKAAMENVPTMVY
jgi:hypothetical protein